MNLITVPSIKDSGQKRVLDMEKEFKYGKMEANTRATGKTIWQMVEED